ncbi:hypothetical protein KXW16_004976 [Aspergillus fumigatus]|nr:hypothetical protein KXW16_004976 [Aspergillus fumigatus]
MRDQLLVADTREKALEEHHKVLAGARGTSTVIAYMDLGSLDSHNVYAAELYTVEMTLTPEGNAESLSSLITKRRFGPAQSQRAHLVWLEWLPGMTGSVATNGPTSMLKELLIAWGPSGPALVLYAMVRRRLQALIRECWRQLWANNDHGPSLQRVLTAPNRVVRGALAPYSRRVDSVDFLFELVPFQIVFPSIRIITFVSHILYEKGWEAQSTLAVAKTDPFSPIYLGWRPVQSAPGSDVGEPQAALHYPPSVSGSAPECTCPFRQQPEQIGEGTPNDTLLDWLQEAVGAFQTSSHASTCSESGDLPSSIVEEKPLQPTTNRFHIMMSNQPTFSGKPGEDVDLYIDQCRFMWAGVSLDPEEKKQAIATTLFVGLREAALRFGRTLPKTERKDWEKLAQHLRARFPEQEPSDRIQDAIMRLSELRQGTKSLRGYIDEVQELTMSIPDDWGQSVGSMFARGLSDPMTRKVLNAYIQAQKAMSKTVKIEELIRMARACEDEATVVEEVTASRSRDEMFADALNNQSQLIGTLAEQLSRINLSQESNNIARVRFVDSESEEVAEWNAIDRVNAVLLSSLSPIDVHIPQSSNALVELQRVYAAGDEDAGGKRARVDTTSDSQLETMNVGKTKNPKEKRHLKGLDGNPLNLKNVMNGTRVELSLAELLDVAPAARVEFAKLMRLNPADKTKKAPKRVRIHHLEQPDQRNEVHDDCFQPRDPSSTELFYTTADVQAMTTDNKLRAVTCKAVLVDGGSEGNLVARYVVSALKARIVPVDIRCRVATGHDFRLSAIVWLQLTIEGVTRIIAATVVDGDPGYSILLGRHWMSSVGLLGNYKHGTYTIEGSDGTKEVTRTQRAAVMEETKRAEVQSQVIGQVKIKNRKPIVPLRTSNHHPQASDQDESSTDTEGEHELFRVIREAMEEDRYEADSSDCDQGN